LTRATVMAKEPCHPSSASTVKGHQITRPLTPARVFVLGQPGFVPLDPDPEIAVAKPDRPGKPWLTTSGPLVRGVYGDRQVLRNLLDGPTAAVRRRNLTVGENRLP
jgi:hypothetical protein